MCGIAGVAALDGRPVDAALVGPMVAALAHRGPDGEGILDLGAVSFGHRRLSILDTSDAGHQPMSTPDGRLHLLHNGEIYNFLELREELAGRGFTFRTETDTEVILAAYDAWGPGFVERLNGIWALALWDAPRRRLVLSRDRLGVKPLFVTRVRGLLAFASEIKGLLAIPGLDRSPDAGVVAEYLLTGLVDATERTFLAAVHRVPAGCSLVLEDGSERMTRYWSLPEPSDDPDPAPRPADAALVEEIRALLIDAVSLQLRTDVPIGSCLSGGLDSSGIVAVAGGLRTGRIASGHANHNRDRHPQSAFMAAFAGPGMDDPRFAREVAAANGVDLHTTSPGSEDFLATLAGVVRAQDEPFGSTSILAQYHVMRLARSAGVKVLLDGQGADELFGGYTAYDAHRAGSLLRSGRLLDIPWRSLGLRGAVTALGSAAMGGRRRPPLARGTSAVSGWLTPATRRADRPEVALLRAGSLLSRVLVRDLTSTHLPGLLRYEDRNSMAFGIEARVPYLDHRLVEAAVRLPDRLRIRDGERKAALRAALDGLVPEAILDRRDKVGFATPEARWMADGAAAFAALEDRPASEALGLLRPGGLAAAARSAAGGRLPGAAYWRFVNLELWARGLMADA